MSKVAEKEWVTVRLAEGGKRTMLKENIVGYCPYSLHKGYLTKNLLKKHQCVDKRCAYLRKCNPTFWDRLDDIETKKSKIKRSKEKSAATRLNEANRLKNLTLAAKELCEDNGFGILVTQVIKGTTPSQQAKEFKQTKNVEYPYIINYVSDCKQSDEYKYVKLCVLMRQKFRNYFELRHTKFPNGDYVSIREYKQLNGLT